MDDGVDDGCVTGVMDGDDGCDGEMVRVRVRVR